MRLLPDINLTLVDPTPVVVVLVETPLLLLLGCPSRTRFFCRNSSKRDLKSNDEAAAAVDSCISNASAAVAEAAADEDDNDDEEEDDDDAVTFVLPIGR